MMLGLIVDESWSAGVGQNPGRIKTDKIGRIGLLERHDEAVAASNQKNGNEKLGPEQYSAIKGDASPIE
jgi:hypothetical protein